MEDKDKEIKEKILESSEKLFMKYGVRSISMDDIARHLSMSKKTLYQYFVDKDELVTTVTEAHMNSHKKIYEAIRKQSENSIDELHQLGLHVRRHIEEQNPALLFDIQKFHPKAWTIWIEYKRNYIHATIVRNIKQGMKDGLMRADLNPEIIAQYRLATIQVCCDEQFFGQDQYKTAEVQSQVFEHFVFGLCTEKGKKLYLKYKENHIHQMKTNLPKHETIS
ncbi:MAG: hypothetical protein OJF59_002319 [Cytophagales bacterium]|jgi:AcrR family transcriptional regulator|nr:TetR/AcrR family transcriptional regulator [Bacteroidota bacterium]MBS1981500.1 TetR/AcrR family transcriptional regulator [Bacteroidota bacterium]WHZ08565.1 MAG: hypothetical protein OJF59_002319 [Cytophagales bacterium]